MLDVLTANFSTASLYKCRKAGYNEYLKIKNIHDFIKECLTINLPTIINKFRQYESMFQKYLAELDEHKKAHSCSTIESIYKVDCTNSVFIYY